MMEGAASCCFSDMDTTFQQSKRVNTAQDHNDTCRNNYQPSSEIQKLQTFPCVLTTRYISKSALSPLSI